MVRAILDLDVELEGVGIFCFRRWVEFPCSPIGLEYIELCECCEWFDVGSVGWSDVLKVFVIVIKFSARSVALMEQVGGGAAQHFARTGWCVADDLCEAFDKGKFREVRAGLGEAWDGPTVVPAG